MENRKRNTALLLITAGLFILLGNLIGFFTVAALFLIWLGIHKVRIGEEKTGYVLLFGGVLFLISGHFSFFVAIILISLGYFFIRSKQVQKDDYVQKQTFLESLKRNHEAWELRSMSIWSAIGEIQLDLSLALTDQKETTLVFQGIIGDIDLIVPEELGVKVKGTILLGQTQVEEERDAGIVNKLAWVSSNYERAEHRVNVEISYLVGDVNIKRL